MSYAERTKAALNQRDATIILANGIDAIIAQLKERSEPADGWAEWGDAAETTPAPPEADRAKKIGELEEQLRTETDPEAGQALRAKIELLKDKGQSLNLELPGDEYGADEDGVVTVPPADEERRASRRAWALSVNLGSGFLGMDNDEAAHGFALGGPVWLYYGNREAIMQMPDQWKRMLVEDVERDSVRLAQTMGRDLLKNVAPGTPSVTMESLASELEANRGQ